MHTVFLKWILINLDSRVLRTIQYYSQTSWDFNWPDKTKPTYDLNKVAEKAKKLRSAVLEKNIDIDRALKWISADKEQQAIRETLAKFANEISPAKKF